jgi:hypothetical protein
MTTSSSLKRRLDKLGAELPTFEEYLEQGNWGELYGGAETKGPPYPWREGTEETYLRKFYEQLVAIMAAREGSVPKVADPEDDPPSDNRAKILTVEPPYT